MNGSAFPAVSFTVFTVYVRAAALPRDPPDFHFETGSDFMRCVYFLRMCVCVCVRVLSYYNTHCMVKKIKRENRPLIASTHTRYIAHKYFVSKPSSVYIYYVRLAYIIVRKCASRPPSSDDVEIIYLYIYYVCHCDEFFNGLPKYDGVYYMEKVY